MLEIWIFSIFAKPHLFSKLKYKWKHFTSVVLVILHVHTIVFKSKTHQANPKSFGWLFWCQIAHWKFRWGLWNGNSHWWKICFLPQVRPRLLTNVLDHYPKLFCHHNLGPLKAHPYNFWHVFSLFEKEFYWICPFKFSLSSHSKNFLKPNLEAILCCVTYSNCWKLIFLFGMTISCAWKIWEEPNSTPTTQDKFHYKICFFTIGHTLKICHVHFEEFYLSSHQQIQRG